MLLSSPPPATTAVTAPNRPRCILLDLPAEVKELIYKATLLHPGTKAAIVQVTPTGYSRPPLLQTCKTIRSEALKIWYYNTKFHVKIYDFDSAYLQQWGASFASIGLTRGKVTMYSTPMWNPHWSNLMRWLELYHKGAVHGRCPQPVHLLEQEEMNAVDLHWHFLGIMFDVAKAMRKVKWAQVEAVLVDVRPSLIAADVKWKD